MNETQMRAVVAVGKTGSYARAARLLSMTPQGVQYQVEQAEGYLGVSLFVRSSKGCRPTRAGCAFLSEASGLLAEMERFETTVKAAADRDRTTVRVATLPGRRMYKDAEIRSLHRARFSNARISFVEVEPDDYIAALSDGAVDLIFITDEYEKNCGAGMETGFVEEFDLSYEVVSRKGVLARNSRNLVDPCVLKGMRVGFTMPYLPRSVDKVNLAGLSVTGFYQIEDLLDDGGLLVCDQSFEFEQDSGAFDRAPLSIPSDTVMFAHRTGASPELLGIIDAARSVWGRSRSRRLA